MKGISVVFVLLLFFLCTPVRADTRIVIASWYGPGLEGKPMANRLPFNSNDPTIAANRTLPLGTTLLVENPMNGRSLIVVVQDRGPYVTGRDLDLSYAAAKILGYAEKGVTQLAVSIIRK
ncbi:MAG TPA: septal ring lytic transglycosylase RlpA family protein [Candidatus Paceibacterota bacterium]|nr:septal ring lytic transglycosylase RlpA family protein [Candidatus Paceibacterota bacterium]